MARSQNVIEHFTSAQLQVYQPKASVTGSAARPTADLTSEVCRCASAAKWLLKLEDVS